MTDLLREVMSHPKWKDFCEFDESNPDVFDTLVELTKQAREAGKQKISIHLLVERLRWEVYIKTTDDNADFKVDNRYKPLYARMICYFHPYLSEMFELRSLTSAS